MDRPSQCLERGIEIELNRVPGKGSTRQKLGASRVQLTGVNEGCCAHEHIAIAYPYGTRAPRGTLGSSPRSNRCISPGDAGRAEPYGS